MICRIHEIVNTIELRQVILTLLAVFAGYYDYSIRDKFMVEFVLLISNFTLKANAGLIGRLVHN